jgi:hypothetical protein
MLLPFILATNNAVHLPLSKDKTELQVREIKVPEALKQRTRKTSIKKKDKEIYSIHEFKKIIFNDYRTSFSTGFCHKTICRDHSLSVPQ